MCGVSVHQFPSYIAKGSDLTVVIQGKAGIRWLLPVHEPPAEMQLVPTTEVCLPCDDEDTELQDLEEGNKLNKV